jgi:uncharacterized protein (DUF1330 family)
MAAYAVIHVEVTDPDRRRRYIAATPEIVARHGGRFIARGGQALTMEGPAGTRRLVIIEFPDLDHAGACCTCPEYQRARKLRQGAVAMNFVIVDGYPEPLPGTRKPDGVRGL